ncbi:MAG: hypothetical protein CME05_05410 [Gemmatimonadaceae bacterium]|nr:hypothetical protein [Gemmatimonadaceae bacterium]
MVGATDPLANDFETYHGVLDHMARHHLDLLPRLSRGQAFHLEHGAHEAALPAIQEHALDRMLDAYNACTMRGALSRRPRPAPSSCVRTRPMRSHGRTSMRMNL